MSFFLLLNTKEDILKKVGNYMQLMATSVVREKTMEVNGYDD